jgi:hypothetical protein
VLAHNISLINVQASVALHLLDDHPDQARPALVNIKAASHDALKELRTALDVPAARRGCASCARPDARRSRRVDRRRPSRRARRPHDDRRTGRAVAVGSRARRPTASCRRHSPTSHATPRRTTCRCTSSTTRASRSRCSTTVSVVLPRAGNGLVGMRERAVALGGSVTAGPRPDGGFRVAAHLPRQP